MKNIFFCLFFSVWLADLPAQTPGFWVSGYYPGWVQETVPPADLPWDAITHLFHFSGTVHPDGSVSLDDFNLSPAHIKATIDAAHDSGKKVLLVLGGANTAKGFRGATREANCQQFIATIVALVAKYGYDGVDLDWEPMLQKDNAPFERFVPLLRDALKQNNPQALLTAATGPDPLGNKTIGEVFAGLQENFDQINLMTYVLAGPWPGWFSWHGSPLYNGGVHFEGGRELPSIQTNAANFLAAGVKPEKLGIGLAFHGDVWKGGTGTATGGVTAPQQTWETAPTVKTDVAYSEIMNHFFTSERVHFDTVTQTPYLSIDHAD
ncbi:MAG: glycoside hydrolase family 18 protein [Kiritimatiellae bacterium]|jgi:chitinase|nr:glycoside hydrolase family 18 protein [Kiritimatiellia bacterium]